MKSRFLTLLAAITLFAALAMPVHLTAQDRQDHRQQHHHYQLIDIGTFGGPASFINAPFNTNPELNNQGMTGGSSATSTPLPPNGGCFFCGGEDGLVPFVFHAFELKNGIVNDLGALPPEVFNSSIAQAISATGDTVVGGSENGVIDWEGTLDPGAQAKKRIVVHISATQDGILSGTIDYPDQETSGNLITAISYKEPTLHFESNPSQSVYDGTMNKDNSEITGTWKQTGASLNLILKRAP